MTLNHLAQAAKTVIQSSDVILQMSDDWSLLDLDSISRQTVSVLCAKETRCLYNLILNECDEFEKMLDDDVILGHFTDWMDKVVETFVIKPTKNHPEKIIDSTRKFLLTWSTFTSKVIRDLTIGSAPSFGSFHILHLMLEQYLLHKTDLIQFEARMNATLATLREDCCQDETFNRFEEPSQERTERGLICHNTPKHSYEARSNENARYEHLSNNAPQFKTVPDWSRVENHVGGHHLGHATWKNENTSLTHAHFTHRLLETSF
ncbi:transcription factor RFX4-like [Lytechinus pictus]|uniref:transcription factor RFX4-like n=1 Tax=Lytechinus pictus TaxID=7653 RepID=UPI0030BA07DA